MTEGRGPGGSPPRAILITVGNELLLGKTVDTNGAWLGRRLGDLGVRLVRRVTVPDRREAIREAVEEALPRADLVLVSGGLGPTEDDVTREAVSDLLERPLRTDEARLEALRERFRAHGYGELPARNVRQVQIPEGARVMENPHGTAPGLVLEEEGVAVILVPGVPHELRGIVEGGVEGYVRERFAGRLRRLRFRILRTTGIAESALAEAVETALPPKQRGPVELAFLPHLTGVDLRLSAPETDPPGAADAWLDRVEEALTPVTGPHLYGKGEVDLVQVVGERLRATGRTLAAAESCTGGLIARRITEVPGASDFFKGGVIAYADEVKARQLGVLPELLARHGAVSEPVALEMALGVSRALETDASVAVTGIAGPGGGTAQKPVGTVWYAAAVDGDVVARKAIFPGGRTAVRIRSAQAALALLWREVGRDA